MFAAADVTLIQNGREQCFMEGGEGHCIRLYGSGDMMVRR